MHRRAIAWISAAALGAVVSGDSASAATLFTTSAHTTTVSVGAAASATATSPLVLTSATSVLNTCTSSTLNMTVDQNSGGTVSALITSGSYAVCAPFSMSFTGTSKKIITGSPITVAGMTFWTQVTVKHWALDLFNQNYTGDIVSGVTVSQPHASGPMCIRFSDAGTVSGPLTGNGRLDGNYCFTGASSGWSLG